MIVKFATMMHILPIFAPCIFMETLVKYNKRQDIISMVAAMVCLVHCVALPIFFSTLPLFGFEILENIWLEMATILISIFIGGNAIWKGYKHNHHKPIVPIVFTLGMLLIILGNFVGSEVLEIVTKITGATAMVAAHIANWKSIQKAGGHRHAEK